MRQGRVWALLVDAPPLFVREDGIFEIAARHTPLVQAQQERVPPAREPSGAEGRNVNASGARSVRIDRQTGESVPQPLNGGPGLGRQSLQILELFQERIDRGAGG